MKIAFRILAVLVIVGVGVVSWAGLRVDRGAQAFAGAVPVANVSADPVERGRALARLGDCQACHTARGEPAYSGGVSIPTPFGTFRSPNITPDVATGIGGWTTDDFWHAMHDGQSRGGQLLYPVFPYTNYTKLSRSDTDALFAYLKTVPAVAKASPSHDLVAPYSFRFMLVGWRALFFRPGVYEPRADRDEAWNRGAYLVQGLGHCSACHEARNALGGVQSKDIPSGGGPVLSWYAPSLTSSLDGGVQAWSDDEIVAFLGTGISAKGSASGPMADVVHESLQYSTPEDLAAMAKYLKDLPDSRQVVEASHFDLRQTDIDVSRARGETLYGKHCAECHGDDGRGHAPMAPPLAGNRTMTMGSPLTAIRMVLYGGYAPGTKGNPRPFGMPPFHQALDDGDVADVITYARSAWGNNGKPVVDFEVEQERTGPLW